MEKDFSIKQSTSIVVPRFAHGQSGKDLSSWGNLVCFSRGMVFQEQLVQDHVLKLKRECKTIVNHSAFGP